MQFERTDPSRVGDQGFPRVDGHADVGGVLARVPAAELELVDAVAFQGFLLATEAGVRPVGAVRELDVSDVSPQLPGVDATNPIGDEAVLVAESVGLLLPPAWLAAIRQRARQTRQARAAEQHQRASEERLALAREVHDVVAHNLSMVSIQAGAALRVFGRDPERAREALRLIHRTNQQSLADLRRALEVL